jgi:hypothetical protein
MNILESWRTCRDHWPTAIGAGAIGAIPCVGAYLLMHGDVSGGLKATGLLALVAKQLGSNAQAPWACFLLVTLAACMAFSVRTVWLFGESAFGERLKSVFLVVSLEGLMAFSPATWIGLVALAALICINGVATACHIVSQDTKRPEPEEESPVLGLNPVRVSSRQRVRA